MKINWKQTQERLKVTPDNQPGARTLKTLLDKVGGGSVDIASAKKLSEVMDEYGLNTPQRLAAFIAQTAHESAGYKFVSENLNYSAPGLRKTWPARFPSDTVANAYARQPERIANRVYGGRMGNGPESSGDGWMFRGRSWIQTTGRANYEAFAKWMKMSIIDAPAYLQTPEGAVMGAIYFWQSHNLNSFSDIENIPGQTKVINGGLNGISERLAHYKKALALLQ